MSEDNKKATDWNSMYIHTFNALSSVLSNIPVHQDRFKNIALVNLEQLHGAMEKAFQPPKDESNGKTEKAPQGSDAEEKV